MMIAMPISGSIGHAIGIGLITHTVIKVFTGKAKDVSVLTYVLSFDLPVKVLYCRIKSFTNKKYKTGQEYGAGTARGGACLLYPEM